MIFTAPHNVCLRRDGMPDHKPEDYTSFLAQKFAAVAGGGSLSWSKREIDRTKQHRLTAADRRPDPSNRDPNYLATAELDDSPWHATHRALFSRCLEVHLGQAASRPGRAAAHHDFDIHGAAGKDIDVYLGLKAMACAAGSRHASRHAWPRAAPARLPLPRTGALLTPRGFVVAAGSEHRLQGAWDVNDDDDGGGGGGGGNDDAGTSTSTFTSTSTNGSSNEEKMRPRASTRGE